MAHRDALLAVLRELRPVRRDRRVVLDLPPVGQQVQRRRDGPLRRAEAHRQRVALPRLPLGTPPTPQVGDQLTAVVHGNCRRNTRAISSKPARTHPPMGPTPAVVYFALSRCSSREITVIAGVLSRYGAGPRA